MKKPKVDRRKGPRIKVGVMPKGARYELVDREELKWKQQRKQK